MSHSPTSFFQELHEALPGDAISKSEFFVIHVTETSDSESYRIEQHGGNHMTYWESDDWPTVLAECIAAQQSPF